MSIELIQFPPDLPNSNSSDSDDLFSTSEAKKTESVATNIITTLGRSLSYRSSPGPTSTSHSPSQETAEIDLTASVTWNQIQEATQQIVEDAKKDNIHVTKWGDREGIFYPCELHPFLRGQRVGPDLTSLTIHAMSAPIEIKEGEIWMKHFIKPGHIIVDLRQSSEITPSKTAEAYSRIRRGSHSISHPLSPEDAPLLPINMPFRYSYTDWPDRGVISLSALTGLVERIEELIRIQNDRHPEVQLWVHCRGGTGRTGVLVTALILKEQIQNLQRENKDVNVPMLLKKIILTIRNEWTTWWVQSENQFKLLYDFGLSLI